MNVCLIYACELQVTATLSMFNFQTNLTIQVYISLELSAFHVKYNYMFTDSSKGHASLSVFDIVSGVKLNILSNMMVNLIQLLDKSYRPEHIHPVIYIRIYCI